MCVVPRNHVLDGGAHWRHLANTMDRSVRQRCGLSLPLPYQLVLWAAKWLDAVGVAQTVWRVRACGSAPALAQCSSSRSAYRPTPTETPNQSPSCRAVRSTVKKVKVARTRLPSVEFLSWSRFLAVSLQVTWAINPVVGCHYFPPGLQLLSQPLRGLLPVLWLGGQRQDGCEQFV